MKRLYVVYGADDRPFAETERLRFAYDQALENISNFWWPVSIDVYMREWRRWYRRECSNWDFYFIDRKNEAILPEDLSDMWVLWYNVINAETKEELELHYSKLAKLFELKLNDQAESVYNQFYSLKKKKND